MEHTFNGRDLVQSLGSVLTGALPLLLDHRDALNLDEAEEGMSAPVEPALGAKILHTVRRYLTLLSQDPLTAHPRDAVNALKNDLDGDHHPAVVHALEQVVLRTAGTEAENEFAEHFETQLPIYQGVAK